MIDPAASAETLSTLADRAAITQLIYRYCRSVDRLDIPLGHSIWHEDGVADYGDVYQGPGRGVIDRICEFHRLLTNHSHQITNVTIELKGDLAASEAYATVTTRTSRDGAEIQMTMWTRYLDRWSKRDGRWGIDRRLTVIDFDEVREVRSLSASSRGRRDDKDPSYAFLGTL
jgi:hypothetical protein